MTSGNYHSLLKLDWLKLPAEVPFLNKEQSSLLPWCTNDTDRMHVFCNSDKSEDIIFCHSRNNAGFYTGPRCNSFVFCSRCAKHRLKQCIKNHPYIEGEFRFVTLNCNNLVDMSDLEAIDFIQRKNERAAAASGLTCLFSHELAIVSLYPKLKVKIHTHCLIANGDLSKIKFKGGNQYSIDITEQVIASEYDYNKKIEYMLKPINLTEAYSCADHDHLYKSNENMKIFINAALAFYAGCRNQYGFIYAKVITPIIEDDFVEIPEKDLPVFTVSKFAKKTKRKSNIKYIKSVAPDTDPLYDEALVDLEAASYLSDT